MKEYSCSDPVGGSDDDPPTEAEMKKAVEMAKRGAAGTAQTTQGRSRQFIDRSKYDRKREKGRGKGEE